MLQRLRCLCCCRRRHTNALCFLPTLITSIWHIMQGMEGAAPVLRLPDGLPLVGRFEETVGTQLVFGDEVVASDGSHRVHLVAHTDKRIVFSRPPQADGSDLLPGRFVISSVQQRQQQGGHPSPQQQQGDAGQQQLNGSKQQQSAAQ